MMCEVVAERLAKFPCGQLYSKYIQTNATNILATASYQVLKFACAMNKKLNKITGNIQYIIT